MPHATADSEPALIDPTKRLHASWLESRDEWGRGEHQAGAGSLARRGSRRGLTGRVLEVALPAPA
ncbi:MAG TPA: hypothetical protein VK964_11715 [Nocardioidaceae bacterium]|nr:hypothetical protein [Nocardioidaceae bacterium]